MFALTSRRWARRPRFPRVLSFFLVLVLLSQTLLLPARMVAAAVTQLSRPSQTSTVTGDETTITPCPAPSASAPSTPTLLYLGPTAGTYGQPLTLAAQLTDASGMPLVARSLTFRFGARTGTATTDANGLAQISALPVEPPGPIAASIAFAGDAATAAAQLTETVTIARQPTVLDYLGALPGTSAPRQLVRARLSDPVTAQPIADAPLRFQLGLASGLATTDATGVASATLTLSPDQIGDPSPLVVRFAGDVYRQPADLRVPTSRALSAAFGAAIVRHAPTLNGNARVEGDVRQLTGEGLRLSGNATITGDLLLPGTPTIRRTGQPMVGAEAQGGGSDQPSGYPVTLSGNAAVGRLVTHTDPVTMSALAAPPAPTGTRDVTLNRAGESFGDPATLRDLTLSGSAGAVAVPPGTYGAFTANAGTSFVLGLAGATQPAVYQLQRLTLRGPSNLRLVGPVVLNLASGLSVTGQLGVASDPLWLTINVASGGVTLNGGATLIGIVRAPAGEVVLVGQSRLHGAVFADRLTLDGGAVIEGLPLPDPADAPALTAQQRAPATILPGQDFTHILTISNTSQRAATSLTTRFEGIDPPSATVDLGTLDGGSQTSAPFAQNAPPLPVRTDAATDASYHARLAAIDGQLLAALSTITFADAAGQGYAPLHAASSTTVALPHLVLGLSAPACVNPGTRIPYTVRVANLGRATATGASAEVTFPDGSTGMLPFADLAPGATLTGTLTWSTPALPPRQTDEPDEEDASAGETSRAYLERLAAADGTVLTARAALTWQDARSAAYGPLAQQVQTTQRVPILTLTPQIPTTLVPGQEITFAVTAQNTGGGNATDLAVQVTNPDGTTSTATAPALLAGQSRVLETTWQVPAVAPKGTDEDDAAYLARLTSFDTQTLHFGILLAWADVVGNPYGQISGAGESQTPVPIVTLALTGPEAAQAGETISYTLTLENRGHALATGGGVELTFLGGTTQTLELGGPLAPGERRQLLAAFSIPSTQPSGAGTTRAAVIWQGYGAASYGPLNATATTMIAGRATPTPSVLPTPTPVPLPLEGASLTLAPSSAGPNVTGTSQTMRAMLTDRQGTPLAGVAIQFTVTGANPTSGSATTGADGVATFTYTGTNNGTDTVQAIADDGRMRVTASPASVGWVTPLAPISTTTVWGRFFTNPRGSIVFDKLPTDTPIFTQAFPTLNFNPIAGSVPGAPTNLNQDTRPFTNVTTDLNGHYSGSIVAQGNGVIAGLGSLRGFEAVFTGAFVVQAAGTLTLKIYSDDGFNWGVGPDQVGHQPHGSVSGSGVTTFEHFPVLNTNWGQWGYSTVSVTFPAPGMYPYEIDYAENGPGGLSFSVLTTVAGNQGVPPSGALTLSPASVTSKPTGQAQTFSVTATDASGIPQPNLPVSLRASGANEQQLFATTDANGHASFSYTGANVGTDTVQANAWVNGIAVYSNEVSVPWTQGVAPPGDGPLAIPGWLGAPANQSTVSGQVPIKLASGITLRQGSVDYWPADDSSLVTTLVTNVSGSGGATLATLDTTLLVNGSYIIRLRGTDSSGKQVNSGVLITVVGEYKLGRVRFSVTDLTVPVVGLPITIGRTYDSLERNHAGDFGYGWSLSVGSPRVKTDQAHNVTLTQPDGRRVTFYFTPKSVGGIFGFLLQPAYTAEPGVYGSLSANGCGLMVSSGGQYVCFLDDPTYNPSIYTYTDPYGRVFTMGSDGTLKSIRDLNNNTLSFSADGISSSAGGLNVPFVRDSRGRITQITDPAGNVYRYEYDASGDLTQVFRPNLTAPIGYTYAAGHMFLHATDPRGTTEVTSAYYPDGRLQSETDALGNTTRYTYDLGGRITTVTNPDGGTVAITYDAYGMPVRRTDPLNRTTSFTYDSKHNLLSSTNGGGETTTYTYDSNGNRTSVTNGLGKILVAVTYNQYGRPTVLVDAVGHAWNIAYDPSYLPTGVSDSLGSLGRMTWTPQGNPSAQIDASGATTTFTYDQYGNSISQTDPLSRTTSFTYDLLGRQLTRTDPLGKITALTYDRLGRVVELRDARNSVTSFTYDNNGNRVEQRDALGRTTRYEYDAANRLTKIIYPDGTASIFTYDFRGNRLTETDAAGRTIRYTYDLAGQLVRMTIGDGTPDAMAIAYTYDNAGRKLTQSNGLGQMLCYTYDDAGRLIRITDALAHATTYTYDDAGRVLSITDPLNRVTRYEYDARGRLTKTIRPDGATEQQTYDAVGRVSTSTNAAGEVTGYGYDSAGEMISAIRSVGTPVESTIRYEYDLAGRRIAEIDPRGYQTTFTYDAIGQLTSLTDPLRNQEIYTYDAVGQQVSVKDKRGSLTTYAYDQLGRLTQVINPDSTSIQQSYDPAGRLFERIDPAGHTTRYQYDGAGRVASVTSAYGTADASTISYAYDATGRRLSQTDPLSHTTSYSYNAAGQLTSQTDPLGYVTRYTYDAAGQRVAVTDANGRTTIYEYDSLGRLTKTTFADMTFTLTDYDRAGRVTKRTDQAGHATTYTYDAADHLTAVKTPLGYTTSYTYDAAGNLLSIADANNHVTGFAYDALDRAIKKTWPDGSFEAWNYDENGNPIAHRLADGNINTLAYDAMNRPITLSYFDGQVERFAYTVNGLRASATDGRGTTSYTYDALDRPTSITTPQGQHLTYTYDQAGNRTSMTTAAGTVSYGYDARNLLTSVTGPQNGATTYTYDPVGLITAMAYPNGLRVDYEYDALNRVRRVGQYRGAGTTQLVGSYTYTRDPVGNLLSATEADGRSVSWGYDADGRLLEEQFRDATSRPISLASFTYDPVGNRMATNVDGFTTNYTYNELDQLVSAGTAHYQYDARGNLAGITDAANVTSYTYDAKDQLRGATLPGGASASFWYDADGRRVRASAAGQVTNYVWDEASTLGDVVLETDGAGATTASYVLGNNSLISQTRGGAASYYLHDGQRSVRALTDANGAVTDTYAYTAFGEARSRTGTTVNPYQYTGQFLDQLTGLYNLRARYYDPALGRFLTRDTWETGTSDPTELNRYAYTANNPINRADPNGHLFVETGLAQTVTRIAAATFTGAVAGFVGSAIFYTAASLGACGDRLQNWARSLSGREVFDYIIQSTLIGAAFGSVVGIAAAISPAVLGYTTAVLGGIGVGMNAYDIVANRDLNLCNGIGLVASIGGGLSGGSATFQMRIPKLQMLLMPNLGSGTASLGWTIASEVVTVTVGENGAIWALAFAASGGATGGGGGGGGGQIKTLKEFDQSPAGQKTRSRTTRLDGGQPSNAQREDAVVSKYLQALLDQDNPNVSRDSTVVVSRLTDNSGRSRLVATVFTRYPREVQNIWNTLKAQGFTDLQGNTIEFIDPSTSVHAERQVLNMVQNPQQIQSISVGNYSGPCPGQCQPALTNANLGTQTSWSKYFGTFNDLKIP